RVLVNAAICVACVLAVAYASRLNGADPFGRWQTAHRSKTIGATSLANVTGPACARPRPQAVTVIADAILNPSKRRKRVGVISAMRRNDPAREFGVRTGHYEVRILPGAPAPAYSIDTTTLPARRAR